jgi:hypothetical protein
MAASTRSNAPSVKTHVLPVPDCDYTITSLFEIIGTMPRYWTADGLLKP